MINLRYHIVSITAVFLALGIGLVFGATFIDRATVEQLERNLVAIEEQNEDLGAENQRLSERIATAERIDEELRDQGLEQLVAGRLDGVPVLLLAVAGVDEEPVRAVADAVADAGAELAGTLWLTDRLLLDDEGEIEDLAEILQLDVDDPTRLQESLARRLGALLADAAAPPAEQAEQPDETEQQEESGVEAQEPPAGDPPVVEGGDDPAVVEEPVDPVDPVEPVEPTPEPSLISALRFAEFLRFEPWESPPDGFVVVPDAGLRVVVVSGSGADLPQEHVLEPLLARLTRDSIAQVGGPVVVAAQRGPDGDAVATDEFDPDGERVRFVGPLREDETLRDRLSTVDDLELFPGLAAVVLALDHGVVGQYGHYGIGEGAQSVIPGAPEPEGG